MKKITFTLLSAIFLMSCGEQQHTDNHQNKQQESNLQEETIEQDVHHNHESEEITFNNGEKWKVIESMLGYIRNMEDAVKNFEGENYTDLAKTIDENVRSLTKNCTMEGQAHNELHKWLVPFIELSEQFNIASDKEEQERIYKEFVVAFEEFNTYFK